jgi:hypothetical protein
MCGCLSVCQSVHVHARVCVCVCVYELCCMYAYLRLSLMIGFFFPEVMWYWMSKVIKFLLYALRLFPQPVRAFHLNRATARVILAPRAMAKRG